MFKKHYVLSLAAYLLIPAITLVGGAAFRGINPEIAAGHPNYTFNYRLLDAVKEPLLFNLLGWVPRAFARSFAKETAR